MAALDETTWEFKLRQGVKFHNGDPFSAEDVKFSFERVLDPDTKSPQYGNIRAIKEVKIIDPHTVHLITDKPFPLLLERMVFFPIIPKKYFEKVGAQAFAEQCPGGHGPYKFVEWKRDQYLKMERFKEHWRGPAPIKNLHHPGHPRDVHAGRRTEDGRRRYRAQPASGFDPRSQGAPQHLCLHRPDPAHALRRARHA